jgi:hypothetical protein
MCIKYDGNNAPDQLDIDVQLKIDAKQKQSRLYFDDKNALIDANVFNLRKNMESCRSYQLHIHVSDYIS